MIAKLKDIGFILVITAVFSVIANLIGFNGELASGSLAALVLLVITFIGCRRKFARMLQAPDGFLGFFGGRDCFHPGSSR